MLKFDMVILDLFDRIGVNDQEIEQLSQQRDELLPLLMNGQVSVRPTAVNCDLSLALSSESLFLYIISDELVFSSLTTGSSLYALTQSEKTVVKV